MNRIKLHDKYFVPFLPNEEIQKAVEKVADQLNNDFKDIERTPLLLCTLNGAIVFAGELLTKLNFKLALSSIRVSSYQGTQSSGTITDVLGLLENVEGRTVVVIEDIVDTGTTINYLCDKILGLGAKEVKICTLFVKPDIYKKERKLDYVGMELPNKFVVGHGLDYNQLGRNIADLYILEN